DLARGHDAERVAVLVRARDGLITQRAGGTRPVFDHHRLAEFVLQGLCDDAANDIGAAAGSERDDDAHRPLRPVLRPCGAPAAEPCGGTNGKQAASREHKLSSLGRGAARPAHAPIIDDVRDFSVLTCFIPASCCGGHELNTPSGCRSRATTSFQRAWYRSTVGARRTGERLWEAVACGAARSTDEDAGGIDRVHELAGCGLRFTDVVHD